MRIALASLTLAIAAPAQAQEAQVRAVIGDWYAELAKREARRPHALFAPGHIDATPPERYEDNGAASLGPRRFTSLAATALEFRYEVDSVRVDASFARVQVLERGYFYAWAAQSTYERAASTIFVLERQGDGRWLILAHRSDPAGLPPNRVTRPMPDLRDRFYATEGKDRDPAADARNAAKFVVFRCAESAPAVLARSLRMR
ncbi:hypothetical protein P1X14_08790 [Sphingomonas sp. AOB5]|uniref:hypothetical protein n=1 Tax=Sphingomonas sp. AOB5 TaxID=3034017 RepID=UPI0023F81653|nr:hypothetical protein [Sphingomonas sp. AOB5]MDF7775341.1 hypothetical protein [Sphingomonas sp. AOB5]